jgi:lipopolysaccharide export system permease protein
MQNGMLPALKVAAARFFLPRSYALWVATQIVLYFLAIALLVESIFLSEHFIDLVGDFADEIGSVAKAFVLAALTAPEVHFAIPVAMFVAVYLVLLRCRERRELIAIAAVGIGGRVFARFAMILGVATMVASFVVTGTALPYARFDFRRDLFAFRNEAIKAGGAAEHFYMFRDNTVFKWPASRGTDNTALFVYQSREDRSDRAISAGDVQVMESPKQDTLELALINVIAADVPRESQSLGSTASQSAQSGGGDCANCPPAGERTLRAGNYLGTLKLSDLSDLEPRGSKSAEWSSSELLSISPPPGDISNLDRTRELMSRFARGLLCLCAPFFALLAVGYTTRWSRPLVLPAACGLILCLDVLSLTIVRALAAAGAAASAVGLITLFVLVLIPTVWQINARQSAIIRPAFVKA